MDTVLIAESGSTKTDWRLIDKSGQVSGFKTSGINPYLQSPEEILTLLKEELVINSGLHPDSIYFYGAGCSSPLQQEKLSDVLSAFFKIPEVQVECDMLAAARALCGEKPGIACILGTGSNSCFYDGQVIKDRHISLGYLAGDEGSGNYLGKRILQYYTYKTFDEELNHSFEQLFGRDTGAIIRKLYSEPFPNRYLASFVLLLKQHRGHYMVENIIEDGLNDFFHFHIMKFRQSWNYPLYFTGSVAFEFQDVLKNLCEQYELELGSIEKNPVDGLVAFHQRALGLLL